MHVADHLSNILRLGVKELRGLWRDPVLLMLIVFAFSVSVYMSGRAMPAIFKNTAIAIVDEDQSSLSTRIAGAFLEPHFAPPQHLDFADINTALNSGKVSFALIIPAGVQRNVLTHKDVTLQLGVDATHPNQALTGSSHIQQIVTSEISTYAQRKSAGDGSDTAVDMALRARFNPTLDSASFASLMQLFYNLTMLSIILTGAALIKEREQGTIEHLLSMPVTPVEIMLAKMWSMGLVVFVATLLSLFLVIHGWIGAHMEGSIALFLFGLALSLLATTALGIFFGTVANSMPQFGLLMILCMIPMQMLSGGMTPRESMPELVQKLMLFAPTTHFVDLGQAILYRGAGIETVWKPFLWLACIGSVLFWASLARFRKTLSSMA